MAANNSANLASLITEVAGLIVIAGGFGAAILFLARMSRQWAVMQHTLADLVDKVREIVLDKDKEHAEIRAQMLVNEQRLDRHEQWHLDQAMKGHPNAI